MIRVVLPLVVVMVFAVVAVVLYMAVRRFNHAMTIRAKRDEIRLKTEQWQATASLEDLARMRRRLEHDLDELHADMDRMGHPVEDGRLQPPPGTGGE
jgi:uncharacterized membrane protein